MPARRPHVRRAAAWRQLALTCRCTLLRYLQLNDSGPECEYASDQAFYCRPKRIHIEPRPARYIGGGPTAARAGRLLRCREHRLSKRLSAEKSSAWSPITLLAQPPPKSDSGMGLPKAASYGWSGGYAALTCFPDDTTVLTVEYKINFIAPAAGDHLQAEGIVLKWDRTLTVCRLEVHARGRASDAGRSRAANPYLPPGRDQPVCASRRVLVLQFKNSGHSGRALPFMGRFRAPIPPLQSC